MKWIRINILIWSQLTNIEGWSDNAMMTIDDYKLTVGVWCIWPWCKVMHDGACMHVEVRVFQYFV